MLVRQRAQDALGDQVGGQTRGGARGEQVQEPTPYRRPYARHRDERGDQNAADGEREQRRAEDHTAWVVRGGGHDVHRLETDRRRRPGRAPARRGPAGRTGGWCGDLGAQLIGLGGELPARRGQDLGHRGARGAGLQHRDPAGGDDEGAVDLPIPDGGASRLLVRVETQVERVRFAVRQAFDRLLDGRVRTYDTHGQITGRDP
ncbi:hypothetical protein [Streptomyces sp. NPDC002692]